MVYNVQERKYPALLIFVRTTWDNVPESCHDKILNGFNEKYTNYYCKELHDV